MFAQVGWKFLVNRGNPSAFEPPPGIQVTTIEKAVAIENTNKTASTAECYSVVVDGRNFNVSVTPDNKAMLIKPSEQNRFEPQSTDGTDTVLAPMAGNILKVLVNVGSVVGAGEVVVIMEAMKMETDIRSKFAGIVSAIHVKEGSAVASDDILISL
jgi:oxaloacetate decarboxylase alpha subunit